MENFTLSNLRFKWEEINLTRNDIVAKKIVSDIFLDRKKFSLILKGTSFQTLVWSKLSNLNDSKINFLQRFIH